MFENKASRRMLVPKRESEEWAGCRTLYDKQLHNLCSSPNIIKMTTLGRRWAAM
jgi:hypothetical protein